MARQITLDGQSLMAVIAQNYNHFYKQDWYAREPFACSPWRGTWELPPFLLPCDGRELPTKLFPAVVWAQAYVDGGWKLLNDVYVWTSDQDHSGDRVYLGMAGSYGGLQIHRALTIDRRWCA